MTAIRVENLSKRYVLRHNSDRRDGLRHSLEAAFRAPLNWLKARKTEASQSREEFWALKDVSFEIQQGDAVAIIGRNGAGKSTLLKILSRITEPTKGRINLKGRVASLLEVGTGFHQELTGRENIFLNGAILGMSRAEIKSRFDEIVAFSEVEKFLDTPVKRYSSGMYVRLAFSVAAHLEPEILIVDEVLAVGDSAFQKKCLGRMGAVAKGGRTVLFVSHNLPAIETLCSKAVYLAAGQVETVGDVRQVVTSYTSDSKNGPNSSSRAPLKLDQYLTLTRLSAEPPTVTSGSGLSFVIEFAVMKDTVFSGLTLLIDNVRQVRTAHLDLRVMGLPINVSAQKSLRIVIDVPSLPLVEGEYSLGLMIKAGAFFDNLFELASFTVNAGHWKYDFVRSDPVYRGVLDLPYSAAHQIYDDGLPIS